MSFSGTGKSLVWGAGTGLMSMTGAGKSLVWGAGTGFSAVAVLVVALNAGHEASGKQAISINACSVESVRQTIFVDACLDDLCLRAAFLCHEHLEGGASHPVYGGGVSTLSIQSARSGDSSMSMREAW